MAKGRFIHWLVRDWWLKIIALLAAVILWFFARLEREYTRELMVGLDLSLLPPEYVVVEKNVDSVMVEIKAKGRYLIQLGRKTQPRIILPLATMKPGVERMRIGPENVDLPPQIQIRSLDPYQIVLRIDEQEQRIINIVAPPRGKPADGYAVSAYEYENTATLYGTKEMVSTINQLFTDSVEVEGRMESFEQFLQVQLPRIEGLTVIPDSILVRVAIEPESTVVFGSIPIQIIGSPLEGQAYLLEERVKLTLTGPVSLMRDLAPEEISVNISVSTKSFGDYRIPAQVSVPPRIEVNHSEPDIFRVLIR